MSQITKKALAASLKELLTKTTLDKITVKDITDLCEVNRQTFYYHFQDIYDLLEWIFITEGEEVLKDNRTCTTWQEGFLQVFQYLKSNRNLVEHAYSSITREQLESYLYSHVQNLLYGVVEEHATGLNVSQLDREFIANFYKYAFVGLVLEWMKNGMKEEPEEIMHKLSLLLDGSFYRSLLQFDKPK